MHVSLEGEDYLQVGNAPLVDSTKLRGVYDHGGDLLSHSVRRLRTTAKSGGTPLMHLHKRSLEFLLGIVLMKTNSLKQCSPLNMSPFTKASRVWLHQCAFRVQPRTYPDTFTAE